MTTHSGPIVATKGSLTAVQCAHCGFIHLDPIPTELPYASGRYHRDVKPDYRKEYDEDAEWWSAVYGDWLTLLYTSYPVRRLLDVGSGTGHFARVASTLFPTVLGIEPDERMASLAEYLVMQGEYKDVNSGGWHTISAHFVMEHLPDPRHFLQWARDRLAKDGLLLVTIPNDFSKLQIKYRRTVYGLNLLESYWLNEYHISYWNHESFSRLLVNNGYEILEVYGSWEPEEYLFGGMNYLVDHTLGRTFHQNRMEMDLEMTREQRLAKYLKLGREGRGRDLTFLCRKQ